MEFLVILVVFLTIFSFIETIQIHRLKSRVGAMEDQNKSIRKKIKKLEDRLDAPSPQVE